MTPIFIIDTFPSYKKEAKEYVNSAINGNTIKINSHDLMCAILDELGERGIKVAAFVRDDNIRLTMYSLEEMKASILRDCNYANYSLE